MSLTMTAIAKSALSFASGARLPADYALVTHRAPGSRWALRSTIPACVARVIYRAGRDHAPDRLDCQLIGNLATKPGLVLRNVGLTEQLMARLAELLHHVNG
jgi:hypothetical protein